MSTEGEPMSGDGSNDGVETKLSSLEDIGETVPNGNRSIQSDAAQAALHAASYLKLMVSKLIDHDATPNRIKRLSEFFIQKIGVPEDVDSRWADYNTESLVESLKQNEKRAQVAKRFVGALVDNDIEKLIPKPSILKHAIQCTKDSGFTQSQILEIVALGIERSQKHDHSVAFLDNASKGPCASR
jgi:hypothetical protein